MVCVGQATVASIGSCPSVLHKTYCSFGNFCEIVFQPIQYLPSPGMQVLIAGMQ